MEKKNLQKLLETYGNEVPPEIAEAIKEYQEQMNLLQEENSKNEVKYLENLKTIKENLKFFRHELGTPLNSMVGFSNLMLTEENNNLNEDQKNYLNYMNNSATKFSNLVGFLNLDMFSDKEKFYIDDIAKEINGSDSKYMDKNKIGLTMRYNPIRINENKSIITGVLNTLTENALSWVPEYSRVEQGIRTDRNSNLEILIENKVSKEEREGFGEGKGMGQKVSKELIKNLNGEFHTYGGKSQIIHNSDYNHYTEVKKFGNARATDHITRDEDVYGIKIKLPLKQ